MASDKKRIFLAASADLGTDDDTAPLRTWQDFMTLRDSLDATAEADSLLTDRAQGSQTRDPLADWPG